MKTPMAYYGVIVAFSVLTICMGTVSGASTVTVTNPQDAAAQVYVSGYEINPEVFYPGEIGTVTVHVANAANSSVSVSQPNLIDPHIDIVNQGAFTTATSIGPGATTEYNFVVRADGGDGTYFPLFTVSPNTYAAAAIHSQIKIRIDSTDIRASISKKPDTFSVSKKDTVNVSVVNPRQGDITDVLVIPEGTGIDIMPSESFVGTLPAGSSVQVPFQVTPGEQPNLTFHVSFRNGDNKHITDITLPILLGEDKLAVVPVVNNIALVSSGSSFQLTGDVNNAGITDAKSMVLTIGAPATPVEPYAEYSIGSLASDDFSSFELTFSSNDLSSVPLVVRWKDADGNSFSTTKNLDLRSLSSSGTSGTRTSSSGSSGSTSTSAGSSAARTAGGVGGPGGGSIFGFGGSRGGGLSSFYLPIGLGILVIVAVILWIKRKWVVAKLAKLKKK